ncbi:hypothetical protein BM221_001750 [Beauveria bassiana]|uniref:Uncharacterized protein n=1 Tax=Beauveria bassiana TaxID=176275 RepID=A0A2N6NWJ8_BEABA|nr:hypothetical protein BM221_001750 [Beauveria bassiana]
MYYSLAWGSMHGSLALAFVKLFVEFFVRLRQHPLQQGPLPQAFMRYLCVKTASLLWRGCGWIRVARVTGWCVDEAHRRGALGGWARQRIAYLAGAGV